MRINKVAIDNFMSYKHESIDFSKSALVCIVGRNGSGKSAILDAITWAIWGYTRLGSSLDACMRTGANEMSVQVEFSINGVPYSIIRKRNKLHSLTELEFRGSVNLTQPSIRETQEQIIQTLRMDYNTFVNSAFILQGQANEFTSKGPSDRKKVLSAILQLDEYGRMEKECKERIKTLEAQLEFIHAQNAIREETISRKDEYEVSMETLQKELTALGHQRQETEQEIASLSATIPELEKRKQAAINAGRFAAQIAKLEEEIAVYKDVLSRKEEIECGLKRNETAAAKCAEYEKLEKQVLRELDECEKQLKLHTQALIARQRAVDRKQELLREIDEIENAISENICALCGQALSEVTDHNNDLLIEKEEELESVQFEIETPLPVAKDPDGLYKLRDKVAGTLDEQRAIVHKTDKYKELGIILEKAERAVSEKRAIIESLKPHAEKASDLVVATTTLDSARASVTRAKTILNGLTRSTTDAREQKVVVEHELSLIHDAEQALRSALQEERKLKSSLALHTVLRDALGKNGVVAAIIDSAIPYIEERANEVLARMGDVNTIHIYTQKTLKNAKVAETLDIRINDGHYERDYSSFSGGQKFRIDFAIRIALSSLLIQRADATIETLFIDEGFGTQDANGIDGVARAIESISNDFSLIGVITHVEDVAAMFPNLLRVTKTSEGSRAVFRNDRDWS